MLSLSPEKWQAARREHRQRVAPWVEDRVARSLRGEKHPVYDFLFEYYTFRPAHLHRYSPGINVVLEDVQPAKTDWPRYFIEVEKGAVIREESFPAHRLLMLRWGRRFLETTLARQPVFHCFGLHEWAMVYRAGEVRHQQFPLRLTSDELARFVESEHLCCTHFDAFRFFTAEAAPRNRLQLDRYSVMQHDQPGCIHANMDLYKWAYQFTPFIPSQLVADAFELARIAREIDMRASPYDLSALGFEPIAIETRVGREVYVEEQRRLYAASQPLREQLLLAYSKLESLVAAQPAICGGFSNGTSS